VTKSWRELGLDRDELDGRRGALSMNGTVPANLNYSDWLRKNSRPAWWRKSWARRGRRLFLDGQLEVSDFVANDGDAWTLADVAQAGPCLHSARAGLTKLTGGTGCNSNDFEIVKDEATGAYRGGGPGKRRPSGKRRGQKPPVFAPRRSGYANALTPDLHRDLIVLLEENADRAAERVAELGM
jgi:hypothetical protein